MEAKISIVVPVYNVEHYLPKCIESVRNQTHRNLEIILVNDGSTDRSGSICDQYAAVDSRIKVVHKENGGLSDARNAGIDIAAGDFLGFVDSDDWIDEDMYELLYSLITEYGAEIAMCRLREISSTKIVDQSTDDLIVCDGVDALKYMVTKENNYRFNHGITNKLIKRELLGNLRFPIGLFIEDIYFTPQLLYISRKCVYKDVAKYNYLTERPNSIMNSKVSAKLVFDELNGYQELERFLASKGIDGFEVAIREALLSRLLYFHYQVKISSLRNKEQLLAALEELCNQHFNKPIKMLMSKKSRAKLGLFELSPSLYNRLQGSVKKMRAAKNNLKPKKVLL